MKKKKEERQMIVGDVDVQNWWINSTNHKYLRCDWARKIKRITILLCEINVLVILKHTPNHSEA